jgi:hypothetical protein
MSSYYHQKPQMQPARQSNGKTPWVSCQYTIYEYGQRPYVCGTPTDSHSQYCTKCAAKRFAIPNPRIRVSLKSYI